MKLFVPVRSHGLAHPEAFQPVHNTKNIKQPKSTSMNLTPACRVVLSKNHQSPQPNWVKGRGEIQLSSLCNAKDEQVGVTLRQKRIEWESTQLNSFTYRSAARSQNASSSGEGDTVPSLLFPDQSCNTSCTTVCVTELSYGSGNKELLFPVFSSVL